jgi:hypothetical protein
MAACDETEAREALGRGTYSRESRDTLLVAIELALRTGDDSARAAAKAHAQRLSANPQSAGDLWVFAIVRDLEVRCP